MSSTTHAEVVAIVDAVVAQTDRVCFAHLNEEYAALCRSIVEALARKRPCPLVRGRPRTWAAGVTHVLGSVNFLFDSSQKPHVRATDLCGLFGVSHSAASAKARAIEGLLRITPLSLQWCLHSRLVDNPVAWLLEVDGILVDARMLPRAVQEEALRRGLIPFVPETPPNSGMQPTAVEARQGRSQPLPGPARRG